MVGGGGREPGGQHVGVERAFIGDDGRCRSRAGGSQHYHGKSQHYQAAWVGVEAGRQMWEWWTNSGSTQTGAGVFVVFWTSHSTDENADAQVCESRAWIAFVSFILLYRIQVSWRA